MFLLSSLHIICSLIQIEFTGEGLALKCCMHGTAERHLKSYSRKAVVWNLIVVLRAILANILAAIYLLFTFVSFVLSMFESASRSAAVITNWPWLADFQMDAVFLSSSEQELQYKKLGLCIVSRVLSLSYTVSSKLLETINLVYDDECLEFMSISVIILTKSFVLTLLIRSRLPFLAFISCLLISAIVFCLDSPGFGRYYEGGFLSFKDFIRCVTLNFGLLSRTAWLWLMASSELYLLSTNALFLLELGSLFFKKLRSTDNLDCSFFGFSCSFEFIFSRSMSCTLEGKFYC